MPELPEVETTRRGLSPHLLGKKVSAVLVRNASLRWPVPADLAEQLVGQKLLDIGRRGKYLLFRFREGHLLGHLGMSGSMRVCTSGDEPGKHDHIDLVFGKICLRYHDPRRFGALLWSKAPLSEHELLSKLGPEPLEPEFNADYLSGKARKRSQSIKTFIMDAHIVVGVGNIYANEALFKAGIRPGKAAGKVSSAQMSLLVDEIKKILANAIQRGGTTLRDFVGGDGQPGYFAQELLVYGRALEPCTVCKKPLKEIRLGQRSTVYCTFCQK